MRIAITADPFIPVPPKTYGGIERIIDLLVKEWTKRGHEVLLIAHRDSNVSCELWKYPSLTGSKSGILLNTALVSKTIFWRPDIIHSFGRLAYLSLLLPAAVPKIMSYQREPTIGQVRRAMRLARNKSLVFTGCSSYISDKILPYAPSYAIHNGVPGNIYDFVPQVAADAPLVFVGRIEQIKGPHVAIAAAKQTGNRLIIAGNIPDDPVSRQYFSTEIEPHIDNEQIIFTGPVNDEQKNKLLGSAKAFLMPILWNEPFGIVVAEAMACGTPVIAFDRGAMPELVSPGINGFLADTVEQFVNRINDIHLIDRHRVIDYFNRHFSAAVIADQYEELYRQHINKRN